MRHAYRKHLKRRWKTAVPALLKRGMYQSAPMQWIMRVTTTHPYTQAQLQGHDGPISQIFARVAWWQLHLWHPLREWRRAIRKRLSVQWAKRVEWEKSRDTTSE